MTKKVYKKKFWTVKKFLTKNLIIFKRWDEVEKWKVQSIGGLHEKPFYRGRFA